MNPRPNITAEEIRLLRRESRGLGNLVRLGLITVTDKGRAWVQRDDERVKAERIAGGKEGGKLGGSLQHLTEDERAQIASAGGTARSKSLTKARKVQIAKDARAHVGQ